MRMADELDTIVEATEAAINTIMESVEQIESLMTSLKPAITDAVMYEAFAQIDEKSRPCSRPVRFRTLPVSE